MTALRTHRFNARLERAYADYAARGLVFVTGLLLTVICVLCSQARAREPLLSRSVLVLDQSGPDLMNPGYTELYRTFRSALTAQAKMPITIYKENLDLDRFDGPRQVANL